MKTDNLKRIIKKQEGFTLVEIIAVLVVLGILAAVAAPKFLSLQEDARDKVTWGGIAECKATLTVAYSKAYLNKGSQPSLTEILAATGFTAGEIAGTDEIDFGDISVTIAKSEPDDITITAASVTYGGEAYTDVTDVNDTWTRPDNE